MTSTISTLRPAATDRLDSGSTRQSSLRSRKSRPLLSEPSRQRPSGQSRTHAIHDVPLPMLFAQDIALGCYDQPVGIDPKADGATGKGRRNAVAIALEADQTCG